MFVIYKQLKLFAFFRLVQAFYDLLCHRVGTRFHSSSLAHVPLMTEDLGLLPDVRRHLFLDIGRKILGISVSSDIYTINLCLKYALQMSKKKDKYLEEFLLRNSISLYTNIFFKIISISSWKNGGQSLKPGMV